MQQRVRVNVRVEVPFLMNQDLEVGSKYCRSVQCLQCELQFWWSVIFWDKVKHESQDQEQCRVNTFDPTTVEIDVWEFLFAGLFDDDAWNEVPWYDEKDIDSYEAACHKFRKSMKDNNSQDS